MEEERTALSKEDSERWRLLLDRQQRDLQNFDVETTAMGLNAAEVVAASQEPSRDDEQLSTQGSTLSLSASSSTNSFTSQTPL